jgi:hypothetical protein
MPTRMTRTAWLRGMNNASIGMLFTLGALFLLAKVTAHLSHRTLIESFVLASSLYWVLAFLLFVGYWLKGLDSGGGVLVDCGPHPTGKLFLLYGIGCTVGGLLAGIGAGFLPKPFDILGPALGITFGIYWLIMSTGRLEFREEGIWQYWGLLRWGKIEACRWSGDYTLLLQAKTRFPLLGKGALPVPPEKKDAIAGVLQKHCPFWDPDF